MDRNEKLFMAACASLQGLCANPAAAAEARHAAGHGGGTEENALAHWAMAQAEALVAAWERHTSPISVE